MKMERIKINDGTKTYEIVNQDDEVLGLFTFNPSDSNIFKRYDAVVDALQKYADEAQGKVLTQERFNEAQDEIIAMMDDLVQADVKGSFFSICGPLTPMENGNLFVLNVLEGIGAVIEKETKKRIKKVDAKTAKYLADYE